MNRKLVLCPIKRKEIKFYWPYSIKNMKPLIKTEIILQLDFENCRQWPKRKRILSLSWTKKLTLKVDFRIHQIFGVYFFDSENHRQWYAFLMLILILSLTFSYKSGQCIRFHISKIVDSDPKAYAYRRSLSRIRFLAYNLSDSENRRQWPKSVRLMLTFVYVSVRFSAFFCSFSENCKQWPKSVISLTFSYT